MNSPSSIRFLRHNEIDKIKWDKALDSFPNSLIYARSFFLDIFAPRWNALVLGDYEYLMPLPTRKKWGLQYCFQPFQVPMLGIFGNEVDKELTGTFLDSIPSSYRLVHMDLNPHCPVPGYIKKMIPRTNYILNLSRTYTEISVEYSSNHQRNLGKAEISGLYLKRDIPLHTIIENSREDSYRFSGQRTNEWKTLEENEESLLPHLKRYGVYSREGDLLASAAFLKDKQRLIYWLVGNTETGKKSHASLFLIDQVIKEHAGQKLILDFEGSDIPGVAGFYQRFGARNETYYQVYMNRLPFWMKWLKR